MPKLKYDYSASTLDAEKHIAELNREIRDYCESQPLETGADKERFMSRLLRRAGTAAYRGATLGEGGPFGALLVDFHTADNVPQVVGFGTNHVVPNNDPSAHAEMTAIRNTAERLGRTDLSGLTLITSCECCPMCLSAATGCKIENVYFAATRSEAAKAGFSDEDQYRLMSAGGITQHAQKATDIKKAEEQLNGHQAVVIVNRKGKEHYYYGDYTDAGSKDPTALPIVQAIKKACNGLAETLTQEVGEPQKVFHLPEDTVLISRDNPHPLSLVAADWARIGRVRGNNPDNPAEDAQGKNTTRMLYLNDNVEHMHVRAKDGAVTEVAAERIWEEIKQPRAIHLDKDLGRARTIAFDKWEDMFKNPTGVETPSTVKRY